MESVMKKKNISITNVEHYEKWFKTNDKLLESELEAIKQLYPPESNGIEIGVGTGIFASQLGIKVGVEPSDEMAKAARKKGIQVIKGRGENLPIASKTYQLALMVTADCFLDEIAKSFLEVYRILVNHGLFIIAFLDRNTPLGLLYEKNKQTSTSYKNASFHSATEIVNLLKEAGFKIIAQRQTIFTLDNVRQEIKEGTGAGVFAVIKAKKV